MTLTKKEKQLIKEFQNRMLKRMEMGSKKYGNKYLSKTPKEIKEEAIEELLDFANYSLQTYMKLKLSKKW